MPAFMFEPSILAWARDKRGLSVDIVAAKLAESWQEITSDIVEAWEAGHQRPTPAQVKKLAEIYKRPTAVFLLSHHPEENPLPPDRRTLGSTETQVFSPDALLVIRRARRVQELAIDLDGELEVARRFKYEKHEIHEDPIFLAAKIRADLDIPLSDQTKSQSYSDFFAYLRGKIEGVGVITLRSGGRNTFPKEDARALSFTDKQPYVILINNYDTEGAKNFSLLHELGHVLLREAGICNNFSSFGEGIHIDPLEVFCNQFAASFLVPHDAFLAQRILAGRNRVAADDIEPIVKSLALSFKVSRFVILRRLLATEFISLGTYRAKADEWANESPRAGRGGRSVPARSAVLSNGVAFSSLVHDAYKHNKISHAAAADYLGIKSKHLLAFEKIINKYAE